MDDKVTVRCIKSISEKIDYSNILLRQKKYDEANEYLDKLVGSISALILGSDSIEWKNLLPPKKKLNFSLYKVVLELLNNKILSLCNQKRCNTKLAYELFSNYVIWRPYLKKCDEKLSSSFGLRDLNVFNCAWKISQVIISTEKNEYILSHNLRTMAVKFLHSNFEYEHHIEKFYFYVYKASSFLKSFIGDKYMVYAQSLYTEIDLPDKNLFEPNTTYPIFATHLLDCLIHMGELSIRLNDIHFDLISKQLLKIHSKIQWTSSHVSVIYKTLISTLHSWFVLKDSVKDLSVIDEASFCNELTYVNQNLEQLTRHDFTAENVEKDTIENLLRICIYLKNWLEWSVKLLSVSSFQPNMWTCQLSNLLFNYQRVLDLGLKVELKTLNNTKCKFQTYVPSQVWSLCVAATLVFDDRDRSQKHFKSALDVVRKWECWRGLKYIFNGLSNSSVFLRQLCKSDTGVSKYHLMTIKNLEWSLELHEMYLQKSGDSDTLKLQEKRQNLYRLECKYSNSQIIIDQLINQISNIKFYSCESFEYFIKNYCVHRIKCCSSASLCSLWCKYNDQIPITTINRFMIYEFNLYMNYKEVKLLSGLVNNWENSSFIKQQEFCYYLFLIHKALYYRFTCKKHQLSLDYLTEAIKKFEESKDYESEALLAKGWKLVLIYENSNSSNCLDEKYKVSCASFITDELQLFFQLWNDYLNRCCSEHFTVYSSRSINMFETMASLFRVHGNYKVYVVCLKVIIKILKFARDRNEFEIRYYYALIASVFNQMGYSDPLASKYFDKAKLFDKELNYDDIDFDSKEIEMHIFHVDFDFQINGTSLNSIKEFLESLIKNLIEKSKDCKTIENHQTLSLALFKLADVLFLSGKVNEAIIESLLALKLRRELLPQICFSPNKSVHDTNENVELNPPCSLQWILIINFVESLKQLAYFYHLQGSVSEAKYYLKYGIKIANLLDVEHIKYCFLTSLQNLYVTLQQQKPEALNELNIIHSKFLCQSSQSHFNRTFSVVPGILVQGDVNLVFNVEDSLKFYKEAENYLISLTNYSYLRTIENVCLYNETEQGVDLEKTQNDVVYCPRMSLSPIKLPPTNSQFNSLPQKYINLKKYEISTKIKIGFARYLQAEFEKSAGLMKKVFEYFLDLFKQVELIVPQILVYEEMAILLLHLSKALIFVNNRTSKNSKVNSVQCANALTDVYDSLWKMNCTSKVSKLLEKAKKYLLKAFGYCMQSGSTFKVASQISYELALLSGYQNVYYTVYYLNYSLGLSFRHQMISKLYQNSKYEETCCKNLNQAQNLKLFVNVENELSEVNTLTDGMVSISNLVNSLNDNEKFRFQQSNTNSYEKINFSSSGVPISKSCSADEALIDDKNLDDHNINNLVEKTNAKLNISQCAAFEYENLIPVYEMGSAHDFKSNYCDMLVTHPKCRDWTICSLNLDLSSMCLIASQIRGGCEPLIKRLNLNNSEHVENYSDKKPLFEAYAENILRSRFDASSKKVEDCELLENDDCNNSTFNILWLQFEKIMEENSKSALIGNEKFVSVSKYDYWKKRIELDAKLGLLLENFEFIMLGPWKFMLLGVFENQSLNDAIMSKTQELIVTIQNLIPNTKINIGWLFSLVMGVEVLDLKEVKMVLQFLLNIKSSTRGETILDCITRKVMDCYSITVANFGNLKKVESSVLLVDSGKIIEKKIIRFRRQNTILVLDKILHKLPWECFPAFKCTSIVRMPSLAFIRARIIPEMSDNAKKSILRDGLDVKKTSYVLNPSKDLLKTQELFEDVFKAQREWRGIIGQAPSEKEMIDFLSNYHLFIYCGHNAGERYLRRNSICNIASNVGGNVVLLMGCASLGIVDNSTYDPSGLAFSYIISGCTALVGNLWTVTSGDLDISTKKLLEWLSDEHAETSLLEALQEARSEKTIKLKHLNAAALICYGLPVRKCVMAARK